MSLTRDITMFASVAGAKVLARGALPCSIICRRPLVVAAFSLDFYRNAEAISSALPREQKAYVLLALGYECETAERLDEEVGRFLSVREKAPSSMEFYFLTNTDKEAQNLQARGLNAIACNHNTFLDENRYRIFDVRERVYDAVYLSRVTPCKRHHLAAKVARLLVIGDYLPKEEEYALREMATLPHATWIRRVPGHRVSNHFASAKVGLCMSDREGAMYASAEYLLCGLPVVNTPNIGGRDVFFDPACVLTVEPTEDAIAEGVQAAIGRGLKGVDIRQMTLRLIQAHRDNYFTLLESLFEKEGVRYSRQDAVRECFFHKLGLRTHVSPYISWKHLLRRR